MKLPYSSNGYIVDLSWVKGKARNVIVHAILKKASRLGFNFLPSEIKYLYNAPYIVMGFSGSTLLDFVKGHDSYLIQIRNNCKEISVNNFLKCEGIEKYPSESSNVCDLEKTSTFIIGGKKYVKVAMSSSHVIGDKETTVKIVLMDKKNERHS